MTDFVVMARVTAHNPPWGLQVAFKSTGQGPTVPVTVLHDQADALRVRQRPLPVPGSWGLVAFPYGDVRNGVWLGAVYPSLIDALTTTDASGAAANGTDPYIDYMSHFSGYWFMRDGMGNAAEQYPDGSYMLAASGTTLPTVYRHIVEDNKQKQVALAQSDRIPSPPNPFNYLFHHQTGTEVSVDVSGNVVVSGSSVSGATLTLLFGGTSLSIDASGQVTLALPGSEMFNITQDGGSPSDALLLVSKFITAFNAHTHPDPQGGTTSPPSTPLAPSDVESTIIGISN